MSKTRLALVPAVLLTLAACGQGNLQGAALVGQGVSAVDQSAAGYTACQVQKTLAFLNDKGTTVDVLKSVGVRKRGRVNLIAHRDGPDGQAGTADDDLFDTLGEVHAVKWVGPWTLQQLVDHAGKTCGLGTGTVEAVFSPQPWGDSHLAKIVHWLDGAQGTVDIAMYSLSDGTVIQAIEAAARRGVSVRLLFDQAAEDRKSPSHTLSAALEDAGVDVRWINKTMHHKFAIIDGPRRDPALAAQAKLVSGSANWSYGGGTKYDENTLFIQGNTEVALRLQQQFDYLWDNSRDFAWNPAIHTEFGNAVSDADVAAADTPASDAWFTSDNFRVYTSSRYGKTFSTVRGQNTVADHLVKLILGAKHSILIASGHMRSRPIAEALIQKHQQDPSVDIRVVLDDQEWISEGYHHTQEVDLNTCLDGATTDTQKADCLDRGFLFGYQLDHAGIPVRFKTYAYRWDYHYAMQMHDKYFVIDGQTLVTGSYNLSDNAEHNVMENELVFDGNTYPALLSAYTANFDKLWNRERDTGAYTQLMDQIENGSGAVPLVFKSMSLTWGQVDQLKRAIRAACPAVNSTDYRAHPNDHQVCPR